MNLIWAACQVCFMNKVFGVYDKSLATFFVCQLLTLINASSFGCMKWSAFSKQELDLMS